MATYLISSSKCEVAQSGKTVVGASVRLEPDGSIFECITPGFDPEKETITLRQLRTWLVDDYRRQAWREENLATFGHALAELEGTYAERPDA